MEEFIKRRIRFILNEAKFKIKKDKSVTFAMRVISNYASVGRDGESDMIKKLNRCMSRRAWDQLKNSTNFNDWLDNLINEHQMPLGETWSWILINANNLDEETIWEHFKLYPMVTVLKEEDANLKLNGNNSKGTPEARYKSTNIEIVKLTHSPKDAWKNKTFDLII